MKNDVERFKKLQRPHLIEELKDRAVMLGLTLTHRHATWTNCEWFTIMDGDTVLNASDQPTIIEHYLFGYRDGRKHDD